MVGREADHFFDLAISADQIRCLRRKVCRSARRTWHIPSRHRLCPLAPACKARTDLAGKLVPSTHDGSDKVAVRKSLAQHLDLHVRIVLLDDSARPDPTHQFVFADDGAVGLDQRHEHIEGTSAELERLAIGENFAVPRQDPEPAELKAHRRFGHRIHGRWL
jgi:hypothetical protein